MEKFPKILKGQAVPLRADTYTGHVLDESYNVARNENQKVYTVFETVHEALDFAKSVLEEKYNQVECTIYNQNQELLHYLNPFQK